MFFICEYNLSHVVPTPKFHQVGLDSTDHFIKQILTTYEAEEHVCFTQGHLGTITLTQWLDEVKLQMVKISG